MTAALRLGLALAALVMLALAITPEPRPGEPPPREASAPDAGAAVRAVLESYYEALSERDWQAYAAHFHDGAVLATRWVPPGREEHAMMVSTVPEFVARAADGPGSLPIFEERMTGADVRVRHDLAQAWAAYEARFGTAEDVVEWRGTDAFTLIEFDGAWKIVSLAYTAER